MMRRLTMGALGALLAVSGCETLSESYAVERDDLINSNGIHVYSDLMESAWDGTQFWQFKAANYGSEPFCVRVGLDGVRQSAGYHMGEVHYIAPGTARDVGYVHAPAQFTVDAETWAPSSSGQC